MNPLAQAVSHIPMDRAAFSQMAEDHYRPLLAYARTLTGNSEGAKEIVQEAFIAAWQVIGRFDITRDFGSWLRGITRNKWKDQCRRNRREVPLDDEALDRLEYAMKSWSGESSESEILDRLAGCRAKLPEPLAEAVRVFYDQEMDGESASVTLGIPPATLRKRLERARHALRLCLESKP